MLVLDPFKVIYWRKGNPLLSNPTQT